MVNQLTVLPVQILIVILIAQNIFYIEYKDLILTSCHSGKMKNKKRIQAQFEFSPRVCVGFFSSHSSFIPQSRKHAFGFNWWLYIACRYDCVWEGVYLCAWLYLSQLGPAAPTLSLMKQFRRWKRVWIKCILFFSCSFSHLFIDWYVQMYLDCTSN